MRVRVLYHDNCFDGSASAALFTAFYRGCIDGGAAFDYVGMTHRPKGVQGEDIFEGAGPGVEYACVDFRYFPDARLGWWFDHHQSAFEDPSHAAHFQAHRSNRLIYNPAARSCTKLIADECAALYGFDTAPFSDLIYWADLIDSAHFPSPTSAVEVKEPALKLMTFVEANQDLDLKVRFIHDLLESGIEKTASRPYVQALLGPLLAEHHRVVDLMRGRCEERGGVVAYDLLDEPALAANKFIPYYLYPECHYVVGLSNAPGRLKISVGSNPWMSARRSANIAAICSRYGGGGHPVVGAISLPLGEKARARHVAAEIADELRSAAQREK